MLKSASSTPNGAFLCTVPVLEAAEFREAPSIGEAAAGAAAAMFWAIAARVGGLHGM